MNVQATTLGSFILDLPCPGSSQLIRKTGNKSAAVKSLRVKLSLGSVAWSGLGKPREQTAKDNTAAWNPDFGKSREEQTAKDNTALGILTSRKSLLRAAPH